MTRAFLLALASALTVVASAAPIPEEDDAAKLQRAYGRWADPDKDCRYKLAGDVLTISMPRERQDLPPERGRRWNAPHVLRPVTGDFVAVVRVARTSEKVARRVDGNYVLGGVLAMDAAGESVLVGQSSGSIHGPDPAYCQHVMNHDPFQIVQIHGSNGGHKEPSWVRLARRGKSVQTDWSRDGKTWDDFEACEVDWGPTVQIGVFAVNTLGVPAEVTFDRYTLTQPKKGPEATP